MIWRTKSTTKSLNRIRKYRATNDPHEFVARSKVSEYAMRIDVMTQSLSENPGDETLRLLFPLH
jgi:hypothetical protein